MNSISQQALHNCKRRIHNRLANPILDPRPNPMFTAGNIHYEVADRTRGLNCGGIGAIHQMVRNVGLIEALDRNVKLLKVHLPYHESDHVLNIAYNILAGGTCLEDLELLRNNGVYMDALGARRIPDPTTAGDFCRRFETDGQILVLMEAINEVRLKVWKQQQGMPWDKIIAEWRDSITHDAIAEAVELAQRTVEDHATEYAQEPLPA